jgi:hypothetical protein
MNMRENNFDMQLSGKNVKSFSVEQLREIVAEYPYFSIARFTLTKKLKQENNPDFLKELQLTALYFHRPLWLHYQLLKDDSIEIKKKVESPPQNAEVLSVKSQPFLMEIQSVPEKETEDDWDDEEDEKHSLAEDIQEVLEENLDKEELNELPSFKISEILKSQAADFKKAVAADAQLPFGTEPYHTIDYFASQGIKLDNQTLDQLGIKVRRFTDWLKQMKSINQQPTDLGTDSAMETKVADIAAISNQQKEIVTEAMAVVLSKQGKTEQAIQLYIKLSFLNPHKSAYFASRIENLKGL